MKKIIAYIFVFVALGYIVGCTDFEDYQSSDVLPQPTATLSVSAVADSSFIVDIATDKAGILGYAVLSDTSVSVAAISILSQSISGGANTVATQTMDLTAAGSASLQMSGLMPNTYYKVAVAASNTDGVESMVKSMIVKTDDGVGPSLSTISPSSSLTVQQPAGFSVVLSFDEPIGTVDTSEFSFVYYIEGVEAPAGTVEIDPENNRNVIVTQSHNALAGDYVFLSYGDEAVADLSGNPIAGLSSGVVEGSPVGLYWLVENEAWDINVATIVPEIASAVSDPEFSVQLKTPFPVSLGDDVVDGSVRFIVKVEGKTTIYDVPADYLVVDNTDSTLTIYKPFTPGYGEMVYLEIDGGVLLDGYDNPNNVIESGIDGISNEGDPVTEVGWLISYGYTIDILASVYNVECTSDFSGDVFNFTVTITPDPEVTNGVIITGLEGSSETIKGIFDGDFGTLTIAQDQSLGDLLGDGSQVLTLSNTSATGDLVGHINADGSIVMDWASYIVGGTYDGYYYDRYIGSVWTVQPESAGNNSVKSSVIRERSLPNVRR